MRVVVRLATALRPFAGGEPTVTLDLPSPVTIAAVLDALAVAHPGIGRRIRDEAGAVRPHVNLFLGPDSVRTLDGEDTVVPEGAELTVLPAVSGG
jgi:molybdopterin converting factor small subunit